MLVEFGNHDPVSPSPDDQPKVTTVNIPEFDPPHAEKFGHYGHAPGHITPEAFKTHRSDAADYNNGVTNLGQDAEALLAIVAAWPTRSSGRPKWVNVTEHPLTPTDSIARESEHVSDLEHFLSEFYEIPTLRSYYGDCDPETAHVKKELEYWTRYGAPGTYLNAAPKLPDAQAVYTVDGRINDNFNDGGDSLTAMGQMFGTATASSATGLTGASGLTVNGLANHRIYVYTTSGPTTVWGNVISNTANAITVDQWYVPATPGGSAGTNPGTPWFYVAIDGGLGGCWFAAWGYGGTPTVTNTDHALSTGGQTEYVQAGGTAIRKICPTATDVSATARTVTLVPVFTANATDVGTGAIGTHPMDIVGFFSSIVPTYAQAGGPMKFEDAISPTATMAATGDNVTVTEVISGS